MRIEVKGRNTAVTEALREEAEKRCAKIERQVSELARLEIELSEERNPAIHKSQVVELTLYLKGVTLRASNASNDMHHSLHLACDELTRQVKRHRDKRRRRRDRETPDMSEASPAGAEGA
jgi:putative sigma-54 modulation protein